MTGIRRRAVLAGGGAASALALPPPRARAAGPSVKIGVLTDMSGPYSGNTGAGSVAATKLAIEDFARTNPGFSVEMVAADFQSSTDVGMSIARAWLDRDGVDVIIDVPSSAIAIGLATLVKERDKVALLTGPGVTDLTGKYCGPNHIHWTFDNWCFASAIGRATLADGGKKWFFVAADYAYGHTLVNDTKTVLQANGGTVLGEVFAPFPGTTDFSSFLIQAQAARPDVIAFANSGTDMSNCLKQAAEFGLKRPPIRLVGLGLQVPDVRGAGLEVTQGMTTTEPFYWDLNDATRGFSKRFGEVMKGRMPAMIQAGDYSATLHYLKAVAAMGPDKAKASGRATVAQMKAMPTDDPCFGKGSIRADGRKLHNVYQFQVKTPAQSKSSWDCYNLLRTVAGTDAFRSTADGGCAMVRS